MDKTTQHLNCNHVIGILNHVKHWLVSSFKHYDWHYHYDWHFNSSWCTSKIWSKTAVLSGVDFVKLYLGGRWGETQCRVMWRMHWSSISIRPREVRCQSHIIQNQQCLAQFLWKNTFGSGINEWICIYFIYLQLIACLKLFPSGRQSRA